MTIPSIQEIIEARGGYKAVAEGLSTPERRFPPTTVHAWLRNKRLPFWHEEKVLALPLVPRECQGPKPPLQLAADEVGNLNRLAKKIGKRQSTVWHWLKTGRVPSEWCAKIEEATDGKISRQALRPDVFGPSASTPSGSPQQGEAA